MTSPPELLPGVGPAGFTPAGREAFASARESLISRGLDGLLTVFPGLPRRIGREQPFEGVGSTGTQRVDLARWRSCDVAAALLLRDAAMDAPALRGLWDHGDAEERRMLLRSLPFLALDTGTQALLEEAHRSNDEIIFSAGLLDSSLPATVLSQAAYNRAVLKVAFMDLAVERLLGWEQRADPGLSAMLLGFRSERQAAGRRPWVDSLLVAAAAPAPGVRACILGDLWHGADDRRVRAVQAATGMLDDGLREALRVRLEVETAAGVRRALERALGSGGGH